MQPVGSSGVPGSGYPAGLRTAPILRGSPGRRPAPVGTETYTPAMVAGRWVLMVSMVLVAPLMWSAGIAGTASDARAALPPGDSSLVVFLDSYRSGGQAATLYFAIFNFFLLLVLLPSARSLREGRSGTIVHAVIATIVITGLSWLEYAFNPLATDWGGDPDGWSLAKDHLRGGPRWWVPCGPA